MAAIVKKICDRKARWGRGGKVGGEEEMRGQGRKARWGGYLILGEQQTHILLITRRWILPATGLLVRQLCSLYSCHSAEFNLTGNLIHLPVLLLELHKSFHCKLLFFQTFWGSIFYLWFIHAIWISFSCILENLDKKVDWQSPTVQHSWGESYALWLLCAVFNENPDWNST